MPNSSQRQRENFNLPTERELQAMRDERQAQERDQAREDQLRAEDARKHLQVFGLAMTLLTNERADRAALARLSESAKTFAEEYVTQELEALRDGHKTHNGNGQVSTSGPAFGDSTELSEDDGA